MNPGDNRDLPLLEPVLREREWARVRECLESNWVSSSGPLVGRFEDEMARYLGVPKSLATHSGTSALHLAFLVAGIGEGDEVLVSPLTYVSSANAIRYTGAWPVFIDADPEYGQLDPAAVETFLRRDCRIANGKVINRSTGRVVRAIQPVHVLGHPCDLDPLHLLADEFGLLTVEDAAESLGALYRGRLTGTTSDLGAFSFNGNKIITSGGGGLLVARRDDWASRARYLATMAKDPGEEIVFGDLGYNYRMSSLQSALGSAQLESLPRLLERKCHLADWYAERLAGIQGLRRVASAPWAESNHWVTTILLDEELADCRLPFLRELRAQGIQAAPLWVPLHRLAPYASVGAPDVSCPVAESWHRRALMLPSAITLEENDVNRVVESLSRLISSSRPDRKSFS